MLPARLQSGDLLGIAQIRDVDLIELQIPAPRRPERRNRLVVRLAQVGEEAIHVRIGLRIDRLPPAAEMHHRGRWNRHLRHRTPDVAGDEPVVVHHHRPAPADPAGDAQRKRQRQAALELDLLFRLIELDAIQARDEIEVPVGPPVLAVGRRAQADLLLPADRRLDAAVLHGTQRVGRQAFPPCGRREPRPARAAAAGFPHGRRGTAGGCAARPGSLVAVVDMDIGSTSWLA